LEKKEIMNLEKKEIMKLNFKIPLGLRGIDHILTISFPIPPNIG